MLLIVLALLMRAALPAGTMPVHDEAHGTRVLLCNGSGPLTGLFTGTQLPHPTGHESHDGATPCAFSALAVPTLSGGGEIALPLEHQQTDILAAAPAPESRPGGFAHARPPQRGPPLRA